MLDQAGPFSRDALSPNSRLWLLRMLVPLGGHRKFVRELAFRDDSLAVALGLECWLAAGEQEFDPVAIRRQLGEIYRACERTGAQSEEYSAARANIKRLQAVAGLSDTDCRLLEFAITLRNEPLLQEGAEQLGEHSTLRMMHSLSAILAIPLAEIRASLRPHGHLSRSGLLSVSRRSNGNLVDKLDLLSSSFADAIFSVDADPMTLLRNIVRPATAPKLKLSDYSHIVSSLEVMRPYLGAALTSGKVGVNIFVHGQSGTGKSELAKALAQDLGCELFEIASEDEDGDPIEGERRLRALGAAQSFFSSCQALVLFDEVEDVFGRNGGLFDRPSVAQLRKAWVNRMLEENPVPTLWLSNSIQGIDPAFIRRFDQVIELPVPPRAQRQRIIMNFADGVLCDASAARLAECETLAPAVVARASGVIRTIRSELGGSAATAMEMLIDNTLTAQGHPRLPKFSANRLPDCYDPSFIHADVNLAEIGQGLKQSRAGRLCLYGPPGTGKSAYARWLAQEIGTPLCVKRGSDLLSKYVGESERNLASAFAEAERDGALLLIDEVDSFLQDRRGAQRTWEVTLVNEMLTQIEAFSGILVASTNLMDGFDPAAMRRFDLKVKFDYLLADQAAALLARYCEEMSLPPLTVENCHRVRALACLTPGDFAAAMRQHRFRPIRSATELVAALETECGLKPGMRRVIGFY